jgi:hypothetical protein
MRPSFDSRCCGKPAERAVTGTCMKEAALAAFNVDQPVPCIGELSDRGSDRARNP